MASNSASVVNAKQMGHKLTGIDVSSIGAGGFTGITTPGDCSLVILQCATAVAFDIATSSSPSTAIFTVKASTVLELPIKANSGDTILYGKSASGTISIQVIALD